MPSQAGCARLPACAAEVTSVSSMEELTFVVGRWLRPVALVLDVVRRLNAAPTSSREQMSTAHGR